MTEPRHPAPFSVEILNLVEREHLLPDVGIVLDPFAGVGRVHRLATTTRRTVGIEIEREWAAAHPDTRIGNALKLPFGVGAFDAACTSCCYGNRYSDHHRASDGFWRRSYHHDLIQVTGNPDHRLHPDNAGKLKGTSPAYWDLHRRAWLEVRRVLRPGGRFVLNVSDYIAGGKRIPMVETHIEMLIGLCFDLVKRFDVQTKRMRRGAHSQLRVDAEAVLVFESPGVRR